MISIEVPNGALTITEEHQFIGEIVSKGSQQRSVQTNYTGSMKQALVEWEKFCKEYEEVCPTFHRMHYFDVKGELTIKTGWFSSQKYELTIQMSEKETKAFPKTFKGEFDEKEWDILEQKFHELRIKLEELHLIPE